MNLIKKYEKSLKKAEQKLWDFNLAILDGRVKDNGNSSYRLYILKKFAAIESFLLNEEKLKKIKKERESK